MAGISELAERFEKMTLTQKKSFVLNLKKQVEASNNPAHKKFLNECIQKYNAEFQASPQQRTAPTRSAVSRSANNLPPLPDEDDLPPLPDDSKSKKKKTMVIAIVAAVLGVIVLVFVIDALINLIQTRQAETKAAASRAEEARIIEIAFSKYLDGYPEKTVREALDDYFIDTHGLEYGHTSAYSTGDDVYDIFFQILGDIKSRSWPAILDEPFSLDFSSGKFASFSISFEYDAIAESIELTSVNTPGGEAFDDSDFIKKFLDLIYGGSEYEIKFYAENPDVPDYGATFGIDAIRKEDGADYVIYHYFQSDTDSVRDQYGVALADFLVEHGFVFDGVTTTEEGMMVPVYRKGSTTILLSSTDGIVTILLTKTLNAYQSETYIIPPSMTSSQIEDEVLRIREIWTADREAMSAGLYERVSLSSGVDVYFNTGELRMIEIARGVDDIDYSRIYQFDDGELIFAYLAGNDAHRLYFKENGALFRWRYSPVASQSGDFIDYDMRTDLSDYIYLQDFAFSEAAQIYLYLLYLANN